MILKSFETKSTTNDQDMSITARISTASVDRDGDVMLPSGLDSREFMQNPVVLFGHDSGGLPVGQCVGMKTAPNDVIAKTLIAKRSEFHPDSSEWVPHTIFSLFKQGVLRAFSVGFTITDAREATQKDADRFGEKVKRVITRWKLLEYSVVPIPANQDALAMAVSKGIVTEGSWTMNHLGCGDWGEPITFGEEAAPLQMPKPLTVKRRVLTVR